MNSPNLHGSSENTATRRSRKLPGTQISRNLVWVLTIVAIGVLVAYPVARIFWLAVSDPSTGVWDSAAFQAELASSAMWRATWNTFIMAIAATALGTVVAVPMAWLCERSDMPGRRVITSLVFLTFMNPPLLLGLAYVMIFGPNIGLLTGWLQALGIDSTIYSWWGLIFVTACASFAIIFMTTSSSLAGIDGDLENAARAHGAGAMSLIFRVTLPLVRPAIASGALLSFVLALNAFGVQALIATPARISLLTTEIYSYFSYPVQFSAASTQAVVLIVISIAAAFGANLYIAAKTYPTIAGKGARADITQIPRWARWAAFLACSGAVGLSVVIPMSVVVARSFVRVPGRGFGADNLWLGNYSQLFKLGDVSGALWNSLRYGLSAAALMVLIALALTYFRRERAPGSKFVFTIAEIPFVVPGIVLAIGFIAAFSRPPLALYGTSTILVLVYVSKFLPIAIRFTDNALGQIGSELEEAAYAHGASAGRTFLRVLLPLMKRGLTTAAVLSFIFAFNELSASILLIGTGTQVASTVLLQYSQEGLIGNMNAFAAVLFGITAISYAIVIRLAGNSVMTAGTN